MMAVCAMGKCIPDGSNYKCICYKGYTGRECEKR